MIIGLWSRIFGIIVTRRLSTWVSRYGELSIETSRPIGLMGKSRWSDTEFSVSTRQRVEILSPLQPLNPFKPVHFCRDMKTGLATNCRGRFSSGELIRIFGSQKTRSTTRFLSDRMRIRLYHRKSLAGKTFGNSWHFLRQAIKTAAWAASAIGSPIPL